MTSLAVPNRGTSAAVIPRLSKSRGTAVVPHLLDLPVSRGMLAVIGTGSAANSVITLGEG